MTEEVDNVWMGGAGAADLNRCLCGDVNGDVALIADVIGADRGNLWSLKEAIAARNAKAEVGRVASRSLLQVAVFFAVQSSLALVPFVVLEMVLPIDDVLALPTRKLLLPANFHFG